MAAPDGFQVKDRKSDIIDLVLVEMPLNVQFQLLPNPSFPPFLFHAFFQQL